MLATASILVTVSNSWYMQRAKESGVYTNLIRYLLTAMGWCLATAVFSNLGIVYNPQRKLFWYPIAVTLWVFVAATALGTTIRVLQLFSKLFQFIAKE